LLSQPYSGRWRIACQEPCDILEADERHPATLWNVSVAGAYVAMEDLVVAAGQQVRLSFCLPGELIVIQVTARVAWVNPPKRSKKKPIRLEHVSGVRAAELPPGCGLEFIDLAQMDRTRITVRVQGT
jgi:hypothetical protein